MHKYWNTHISLFDMEAIWSARLKYVCNGASFPLRHLKKYAQISYVIKVCTSVYDWFGLQTKWNKRTSVGNKWVMPFQVRNYGIIVFGLKFYRDHPGR